MDFVPCPLSPAELSVILQHSLQTGSSAGGPANGVGEVVDISGVDDTARRRRDR